MSLSSNVLKGAFFRLKADYLIRSRIGEYQSLLREARNRGYALLSLIEFYDQVKQGLVPPDRRCLVLRHDVDVRNIRCTEAFYERELDQGGHATYYFRLSTAKVHERLIGNLLASGFEVGYHFEEPAALVKRRHLKSRDEVFSKRNEIQEMFRGNCQVFRKSYNQHLRSVCSHGDWINRRLGFENHELIDASLLTECGLSFEAYQDTFVRYFDIYVSDVTDPPAIWRDNYSLSEAFAAEKARIYLLTHERYWYPGPLVYTGENLNRAWEGFRYHFKMY